MHNSFKYKVINNNVLDVTQILSPHVLYIKLFIIIMRSTKTRMKEEHQLAYQLAADTPHGRDISHVCTLLVNFNIRFTPLGLYVQFIWKAQQAVFLSFR